MAENNYINVRDAQTGEIGSLPAADAHQAIAEGHYVPVTDEEVQRDAGASGPGQQLGAFAEGAANALSFGLAPLVEQRYGIAKPEEILGRREKYPGTHMVGQGLGLVTSALTGVGVAPALERAGLAATEAVGLGAESAAAQALERGAARASELGLEGKEATQFAKKVQEHVLSNFTTTEKIGSKAVKYAADNALYTAQDEFSKSLVNDPKQNWETAAVDIGMSTLLGAGGGAALGALNPLWKATVGPKLGGLLDSIKTHLGGIEGQTSDAVNEALDATGLPVKPEIRAILSDSERAQQAFKDIRQSPSPAGVEIDKTVNDFRKDIGNDLGGVFGKTPEELETVGHARSTAEEGANMAKTLADEFGPQVNESAKEFEDLKAKKAPERLVPDVEISDPANPYIKKKIPGETTQIADKIAQLSQRWDSDSDAMGIVRKVLKRLPEQETIGDLTELATRVQKENYNILNPQLNRDVQAIVKVIREGEGDATIRALGEEAPELVARHKDARLEWSRLSDLKDSLQEKLNLKGGNYNSNQAFVKNILEHAEENPEKFLSKITKTNDVALSRLLAEQFPRTAEAVRQYHLDQIIQKAGKNPLPGQAINPTVLFKSLRDLSPELKQAIFTPEQLAKLDAHETLWQTLQTLEKDRNFSNTAPTLMRYLKTLGGTALGTVAALGSHNPVLGVLVGSLTNTVGRDAPDAIKLAMLKFMGSSQKVEPEGFKAMIDFMKSGIKGNELVNKATSAVFNATREVLPQALMPSDKQTEKLSKRVQELNGNPTQLMDVGGKTGHYLPDHATAMGETAANAVNYLSSLRPNPTKQRPLDPEPKPSKQEEKRYHDALQIADQPLIVMDRLKKGTLTVNDVMDLKNLYPSLYDKLSSKLVENLNTEVSKGNSVPYHTRLSLSLFLGQPLDSTMTPEAIQAAQVSMAIAQAMNPKHGGMPKALTNDGGKALQSLGKSFATPSQAREAHRYRR